MNGLIIKLQTSVDNHESREEVKINKLQSSIAPIDFVRLLRKADNKVNPRSATANSTTKSIHETLEKSPELFWYKSKGLLLATESLELLDRNRIRLTFDKTDHEGIMDGGHNAFAIASYFAEIIFGKKFKEWKECKEFWDANYDQIVGAFQTEGNNLPKFSIPIEVIYPKDEDGAIDQYYDYIAEICAARNNNVQLTSGARANQRGYYDHLKKSLDPKFQVIWKPGDSGVIKSEDVVSMSVIPLIYLQEQGVLPSEIPQLNPVVIYSQKGKCVSYFDAVLGHSDISVTEKGKTILVNSLVESSLELVGDIMTFFDKLYMKFPDLYNAVSPRFAGMKSVDAKKAKLSLFRTATSKITYPPAFMYPLITGVTELLSIDVSTERLVWKIHPLRIDLDELEMDQYVGAIRLANYDPQTVGKQPLFYQQAKSIFETYLNKRG